MGTNAGVRRSRFLVTYWEGGAHWVYNYLTRQGRRCSAQVLAVLEATGQWTARASLSAALTRENNAVEATIDEMLRDGLLDSDDVAPGTAERAMSAWSSWNPVAGFFHAATKSVAPVRPGADGQRAGRLLTERDFPSPLKEYHGRPRVALPASAGAGPLAEVLGRRRTWREFGVRNLTLSEMATLLNLTFGVERWLDVGEDRWVALKSSPSGGARHSIEAYLMAFAVDGLESGTYHYCPDSHALTLISAPTSRDLLASFVPTQPGFHDPAALLVMTSVFARVQWKYQDPHAYRVILLDAGHLSQTFALVATSLNLAPFCTAAIDTAGIEEHLGLDGISESVVLALGVGPRPAGKDWAPMHDRSASPRTRPPAYASRLPAPPFP